MDNSPPRENGNEGPAANELDRDREEAVMAMISRKRGEAIARKVNSKAKTSAGDQKRPCHDSSVVASGSSWQAPTHD